MHLKSIVYDLFRQLIITSTLGRFNFCALLSLNKAKIKLNQVINCNSNVRNGFKGNIFIKTKHLKRITICYKTVINN